MAYRNYRVGVFIVIYWFFCTGFWFNRVWLTSSASTRVIGDHSLSSPGVQRRGEPCAELHSGWVACITGK